MEGNSPKFLPEAAGGCRFSWLRARPNFYIAKVVLIINQDDVLTTSQADDARIEQTFGVKTNPTEVAAADVILGRVVKFQKMRQ